MVLALVERVRAAVERFLALLHAMLGLAHLTLTFLALRFDLGLHLERRVLRLYFGLALDGLGLAVSVVEDGLRLFFLAFRRSIYQVTR